MRRRTLAALSVSALFAAEALHAEVTRISEIVRKAADDHRRGRYQEAQKAETEALSLLDEKAGSLDFDIAASLNDLASLSYAKGDLDRAAQLFERSRESYQALAPDDNRLASVLYNLAGVYLEQGKYAQAEPLYRASLDIRERVLGPASPQIAEVWNNLGFLYLHQRKYKEAESWLQKAIEVWENATGSDVTYAAIAFSNLALLRRLQGDFDAAESLYKRALAVEEKVFGREHPEVAATLINFGALDGARGRSAQAAERYRQALALLEKTLGPHDPLAVEAREHLNKLTSGSPAPGEYQILVVRTKEGAEELRKRIANGEDFGALAVRHSIDPNAPNGGRFQARVSDLRAELRVELDRLELGALSAIFPLGGNWAVVRKISEPAPAR